MTRRPLGIVLAAAGLGLGGCGISTEDADREVRRPERAREQQRRGDELPRVKAPPRPAGQVEVNGPGRGTFSPLMIDDFNRTNPGTRVTFRAVGDDAAFRELCAGRIDVVESVRDISTAELAACRRRGIVVAPRIQVASDAVVVASRNESDVGGDCLTVSDVNEIYRAGSTINNWSQVGFDNLPLHTTGPTAGSNVFNFFTQRVFGIPGGGGITSFRSDYRARFNEDEIRFLVTNRDGVERERRLGRERVRRALRADNRDRQRAIDRAVRDADRRALARIRATNERNRRLKIRVNARKLIADNRRFVEREKARARAGVIREFNRRALARARQENALGVLRAERPGYVGYFRFTYYEFFEDQLRPFEIDATGLVAPGAITSTGQRDQQRTTTTGTTTTTRTTAPGASRTTTRQSAPQRPNCIFPSQATITTGQYPLARGILLFVSQQNLRRQEVQAFVTNYLRNAQRVATQNRLVPIPDAQRDQQLAAVTGRQPSRDRRAPTGPSSASPGESDVPGVTPSAPGPDSR